MKIIYESSEAFKLSSDVMNTMLEGISDEKIRNNAERFFSGYSSESIFQMVYSQLPWVKLIHELGQEQYPDTSKQNFQVPDFMLYYESSQNKVFPLLIEVKTVDLDKKTLILKKYQYEVLRAYSEISQIPLVFAIFWKKYNYWTLNPIDCFEEKSSQYKISVEEAMKNDVSIILGDFTYIFDKSIFRRARFSKDADIESSYISSHEKYGRTVKEEISLDNKVYVDLLNMESALLDSFLDMEEVAYSPQDNQIVEISKKVYVKKISNLILNWLEKLQCYKNGKLDIYSEDVLKVVINVIFGFRQKTNATKSYLLPIKRTDLVDTLMIQAFKGTWVLDRYKEK